MSIEQLGALGELIGGIAVIASVLYLALQIRHGLQGYRSNVTQQVTNHFSTLQATIAGNDGLLTAWNKAQTGGDLSEIEQARVLQLVSAYLIGFENMYVQYRNDMLEQASYESRRFVLVSLMAMPGAREWWGNFGRHQHPEAFVSEVDEVCEISP